MSQKQPPQGVRRWSATKECAAYKTKLIPDSMAVYLTSRPLLSQPSGCMIEPMRTASGHPAAIPIPGATSRRRRPRPVFTLGRSSSRSSCNSGSSRSESSTISRTGSSGSSDMIFGPMEGLSQESPALGQTPHRHLYPVANMPSRVVSPEPVPCSRCGRLPGYHTESCEGTSTGLSRYNMSGGTMPLHSLHSTRLPAPRHRINPDESGHHDTGFGAMQSHEGVSAVSFAVQ